MSKTLEDRTREIAHALGALQDEARAFARQSPDQGVAYSTQRIAEKAVQFTEAVRRCMEAGRRGK